MSIERYGKEFRFGNAKYLCRAKKEVHSREGNVALTRKPGLWLQALTVLGYVFDGIRKGRPSSKTVAVRTRRADLS